MKKPLAALLLTAATVAALAVPAGAAVPQRQAPDQVRACATGGKSARAWMSHGVFAADNPCPGQWLMIGWNCNACGASTDHSVWVAPGAHFNHRGAAPGDWQFADLRPALDNCWPEGSQPVVYRGHHGKFEAGGPPC